MSDAQAADHMCCVTMSTLLASNPAANNGRKNASILKMAMDSW